MGSVVCKDNLLFVLNLILSDDFKADSRHVLFMTYKVIKLSLFKSIRNPVFTHNVCNCICESQNIENFCYIQNFN